MLGLRGKSTLWLFYTLFLAGYLGGQSVPNTVWEAKKKKGGVDSWKVLPLHGVSNFVVTFPWPSWSWEAGTTMHFWDLRMLPLRILPVSSFPVVLCICMRCIAMKWETPAGAISFPAPLPSSWGMGRFLHWLGSTLGGNRCQQRLRRKSNLHGGIKFPCLLGFPAQRLCTQK